VRVGTSMYTHTIMRDCTAKAGGTNLRYHDMKLCSVHQTVIVMNNMMVVDEAMVGHQVEL